VRTRAASGSLLVLLGCGAATAPVPAAAPASPATAPRASELAVPEPYRPEPAKPPEPNDPRDPRDLRRPWLADLRAPRPAAPLVVVRRLVWDPLPSVAFAESELWEPCVRDFVRARPAPVRRALTAALARYQTACAPGGGVALLGVRGLDGRERRGRSDVAFTGTLSASRAEVSLRVASCGGGPAPERVALERIVIAADGERWRSPRLSFAQDEHGCDVAELPWTRALARAVWAAVAAENAAITFEGGAQDLPLTDETKQHLRAMLEVLDALAAS
jgi:hypothetical protein